MLYVGLTGGIASGKSTVAFTLSEAGAIILDADQIAHAVIQRGGVAFEAVVEAFGKGILDDNGEINRKRLGEIVFPSQDRQQQLNQLVHPHVFEAVRIERERLSKTHPDGVVVCDMPLLIETGAYKEVDHVLLVYVDCETQLRRLMQRDNLSERAAQARIAAQMPLKDKLPFAHSVIDNGRLLPDVIKDVREIYQKLCQLAVRMPQGQWLNTDSKSP